MSYITNFTHFDKDDFILRYPGGQVASGTNAQYPHISGIQKSSINTIGSFCMSPYGAVSNLDCPDWDPACNCWITQFMPNAPEPSGISMDEMRLDIDECSLIKEAFTKTTEAESQGRSEWWGVDYGNPNSTYNCPFCDSKLLTPAILNKPQTIEYWKIKNVANGQGLNSPNELLYPYSTGLSGISGISLSTDYAADAPTDSIQTTDWKINGGCFHNYLEYSKTNATFWRTPVKTPLLRKGQIGAYNAQKIKILVNGNYSVKPGTLINISIPIGDETNNQLTQKRFSGRWLVYKVERVLTTFKHSMFLYLMRDGFSINPYISPTLGKGGKAISTSGFNTLGSPNGGSK